MTFNDVTVANTALDGIHFQNADNAWVEMTDVNISYTGEHALHFGEADGLMAQLNRVTIGGTIGDGDDALFFAGGAPLPEINGTIENNATNSPDLCHGDHTGIVTVTNIDATVIDNGDQCTLP